MEDTSFYMTLPSSTRNSNELYPKNSASSFTIQLPKTIYLKNKYEVALMEITYPHTWATFRSREEYSFTFVHDDEFKFTSIPITGDWDIGIAKGHYDSMEEVVKELNHAFKNNRKSATYVDDLKFSYNQIS